MATIDEAAVNTPATSDSGDITVENPATGRDHRPRARDDRG